MPIWQLDPIDPNSPHWKASTHIGSVIARAPDEKRARNLCKLAFSIATERAHPGQDVLFPPWGQEQVVSCHRLEDSEYEDDGPDTIFEPD